MVEGVQDDLVCLFDVDDTLVDNDAFELDLHAFITAEAGSECAERYFALFEQIRSEVGYADFIGALQGYRVEFPTQPQLLELSSYLMDYPFANRLYPGALDAIAAVRAQPGARAVILSDGDVIYQPRKIRRAGLLGAVSDAVLVYVHKEEMLEDVERRYPAERYVVIDDKLRLLDAIKQIWGERVVTVFVRQGKHANNAAETDPYRPADHTLRSIGSFADLVSDLANGAGEDPA